MPQNCLTQALRGTMGRALTREALKRVAPRYYPDCGGTFTITIVEVLPAFSIYLSPYIQQQLSYYSTLQRPSPETRFNFCFQKSQHHFRSSHHLRVFSPIHWSATRGHSCRIEPLLTRITPATQCLRSCESDSRKVLQLNVLSVSLRRKNSIRTNLST